MMIFFKYIQQQQQRWCSPPFHLPDFSLGNQIKFLNNKYTVELETIQFLFFFVFQIEVFISFGVWVCVCKCDDKMTIYCEYRTPKIEPKNNYFQIFV